MVEQEQQQELRGAQVGEHLAEHVEHWKREVEARHSEVHGIQPRPSVHPCEPERRAYMQRKRTEPCPNDYPGSHAPNLSTPQAGAPRLRSALIPSSARFYRRAEDGPCYCCSRMNRWGSTSLPVMATLSESVREVVAHRRALGRAVVVPAAVATALNFSVEEEGVASYAVVVIVWGVTALIAVSCHRIILLGDDSIPGDWGAYWTTRETRFLAWSCFPVFLLLACVAIGSLIVALLVTILSDVDVVGPDPAGVSMFALGTTIGLPSLYLMGRASLILPPTAIDLRPRFRTTWTLSRNNGWRVAATTMTFPALLMGAGIAIAKLWSDRTLVVDAAYAMGAYVLGVFEVAALSVTYRRLSTMAAESGGLTLGPLNADAPRE